MPVLPPSALIAASSLFSSFCALSRSDFNVCSTSISFSRTRFYEWMECSTITLRTYIRLLSMYIHLPLPAAIAIRIGIRT